MASRMQISNAIDYAKFRSRSHDAVIRAYDEAEVHAVRPAIIVCRWVRDFRLQPCGLAAPDLSGDCEGLKRIRLKKWAEFSLDEMNT
jgi:hypothetical protein